MEGNKLVDNLLSYAVNNLYLNLIDVPYKKTVLCTVLKVEEKAETDFSENITLPNLVEQLKTYILENKLSSVQEVLSMVDYIFGLIMPLPSIVDRTFKTVREKIGAEKAFSYLYNLSENGNYSDCVNVNFVGANLKQQDSVLLKKCSTKFDFLSDENSLNKCEIILDFAGISYIMSPSRVGGYPYQATLTPVDNKLFFMEENALETMLSFVEYSPNFFITDSYTEINGEKLCDKFFVGKDNLPFFNSKTNFVAKSEIYPDVEVAYVDWLVSTIRLASYNKNTLINTAKEVSNAWQTYEDNSKIKLNDGNKRFVNVFVSMLKDGRYAINLVLRNAKSYSEFEFITEKTKQFFEKPIANSSILGIFTLSVNFDSTMQTIKNILAKKQPFTAIDHLDTENELYLLSDFITSIINKHGYIKDEQKAENAVYDTLTNICVTFLKNENSFSFGDEYFMAVKRLLQSAKIK